MGLIIFVNHAFATNGYFQHGYGIKSQGMGGVGIALPQDSLTAAINPAGMGLIGNRYDFGINYFKPERNSDIVNNNHQQLGSTDGHYDANDSNDFFIPEFGYNKVLDDQYTLGVSIYANGGINTNYKNGIPLFGQPSAGVDLKQIFVTPTLTFKPTPNHVFGVSVNAAYQTFQAKGLQNFAANSNSSANLTDNHHEHSYGAGIKLGWIGQITDQLTLGATYHSKTYMTKLDDYKGLFAEGGDFDIPSHYGFGVAYAVNPDLTVAMDYQRIEYGDIKSVNNPLGSILTGVPLGASDGAGFGWRDINVYKIGFNYQWNDNLTLRAGYNHNSQPIPSSQTFFNILAPGVVQDHITLGLTWAFADKSELSLSYMHAFSEKVNGSGSIPSPYGSGEANIEMQQNSLGLAYGVNF